MQSATVWSVSPLLVARLSGLPVDAVVAFRSAELVSDLAALLSLEDQIASSREAMSAILFAAIGAAPERAHKNALLKLRRDLFNGREPRVESLESASRLLETEDCAVVKQFVRLLQEHSEVSSRVRQQHDVALRDARMKFQCAVADEDFQKALVLSSPTLARNVAKYRMANADQLDGRAEQIERGLLRYFTRAAMKATPFGTFCSVIGGEFRETYTGSIEQAVQLFGDPLRKRAYVRLNKKLYGALWTYIKTRPDARRSFVVELNPTVRAESNRFVFLASVKGREVFQRVATNEALDLVVSVIRERAGATLSELSSRLTADSSIEATSEEAAAYLDSLVDIGLLRFRGAVPEQAADWDTEFCGALKSVDDDHARRIVVFLETLRRLLNEFATVNAQGRLALNIQIQAEIRAMLEFLKLPTQPGLDFPVYEDATADASLVVARHAEIDAALERLAEFIASTQSIAYPRAEQATMRRFFESYYGEDERVPLLQFYEDFFREHLKVHLEKEGRLQRGERDEDLKGYDVGNPLNLDTVRAIRRAQAALHELLRVGWEEQVNATEIVITQDDLSKILAQLPCPATCRSIAAFCQLTTTSDVGGPRLVMTSPSYLNGYGKYFSRFLYMLPDEMCRGVLNENVALTNAWLAEISGDAHFNANLHPPLLPWEISYPTGESGSAEGQLPSSDLDVFRDPEDDQALGMVHRPTGRRVLPVDLGFLNPRMRPPLFQLLSRFAPTGTLGISIPEYYAAAAKRAPAAPAEPMVRDGAGPGAGEQVAHSLTAHGDGINSSPTAPVISYRPRFVYEGCVVLTRRRWTIPAEIFPHQPRAEPASEYFIRVNKWRRHHGIPEHTYIRVIPRAATSQAAQPTRNDAEAQTHESNVEDQPESQEQETRETRTAAREQTQKGNQADVARSSRDWRKPQYIDFSSPLLVRLFAKITGSLTHFQVVIEECYPELDSLPESAGQRFSVEYVLQFSTTARARTFQPAGLEAAAV